MKTPAASSHQVDAWRQHIEEEIRQARAAGVIVEVRNEPLQPLAMGHHAPVVEARAELVEA